MGENKTSYFLLLSWTVQAVLAQSLGVLPRYESCGGWIPGKDAEFTLRCITHWGIEVHSE